MYIDPPYNTGNEGWIYNDNLTQPQFKEWVGKVVGKEGEDLTRHDKWCCMTYPRLQLLKELLSEDGSIWVSIDDNEVHHLRMLLNEVFGEENFIANVVWQKRYVSNVTAQWLSDMHDHILVYAKEAMSFKVNLDERTVEQLKDYKNPDNDERGPWRAQDLSASKPYAAGVFEITGPSGLTFNPPPRRYWRCSKQQFETWLADGRIWWGKTNDARPMLKAFLSEVQDGLTPNTWWTHSAAGHNKEATLELKMLFAGTAPFDSPKPVKLLQRIVRLATSDGDLVLDCTAGSGTTGHAVLASNKDGEGTRRFVLIQQRYDTKLDEDDSINIAQSVTADRVRRVITGGSNPSEATGGTFTYVRLGKPLFDQFRSFEEGGEPSFPDLAKYVFYTETSAYFDPAAVDKKTGFIGRHGKRSYYLLYSPNGVDDAALTTDWLEKTFQQNPGPKVVYAERILMRTEDIKAKNAEARQVPFNLK